MIRKAWWYLCHAQHLFMAQMGAEVWSQRGALWTAEHVPFEHIAITKPSYSGLGVQIVWIWHRDRNAHVTIGGTWLRDVPGRKLWR